MLRTALEEVVRIAVVAVSIKIDSGLASWIPLVRADVTVISGRTRDHRHACPIFVQTSIKFVCDGIVVFKALDTPSQ